MLPSLALPAYLLCLTYHLSSGPDHGLLLYNDRTPASLHLHAQQIRMLPACTGARDVVVPWPGVLRVYASMLECAHTGR